jgi:hypothetical protein
VLLVGREIQHHICIGHHLLVGAYPKAGLGRFHPRRPLLRYRLFTQCVGNIKPAVPQIKALIEALSATSDYDQLFIGERGDPGVKLTRIHESALAQFLQLRAKGERVEIIAHWRYLYRGPEKKGSYCVGHRAPGKRRCYN